MLRKAVILCAIGVFLSTLAGCSDEAPQYADPVEITIVGNWGGTDSNAEIFNEAVEEYTAATGNSVVSVMTSPDPGWELQVISDFAQGSEPDVILFFTGVKSDPIVSAGKLVSIEEIREYYPDYAENISEGVLSQITSRVDGKCYAVPTNGYWEGMYVNTDVLNSCSLDVPKTWSDFLNACKTLKRKGITPISLSVNDVPHYLWEVLLYNFTDADTHSVTIPEQKGDPAYNAYVKTLEAFVSFYKEGYFTNSFVAKHSDVQADFYNKETAFFVDGSWGRVGIENNSADASAVELALFPTRNKESSYYIGGFSSGFMVTRKAWNNPARREACVRFIQTVTSDKYIAKFSVGSLASPSKNNLELPEEIITPLLTQCTEVIGSARRRTGAVQDNWTASGKEYMFTKGIADVCRSVITAEQCVDAFILKNVSD